MDKPMAHGAMQSGALGFPFPDPPAPGAAVEVADGILWLRLPLPMALDHVNVYALEDGAGWTLVDTGMDTPAARAAWGALLDGPLAGRPVVRVIVTHHHPDHIGLAGWFIAQGAALWMPRTGWLFARMLRLDDQPVPPPETIAFWRRAGMAPDVLALRQAERPFNYADCVTPLPLGFRRITEGGRLRIGARDWTVRMGDGHAPEHATLWSGDGIVLGGDQFLATISPNLGVYPTEPEADPLADWLEACAKFAPHSRPDHLVLPGHKLPFTNLPLRLQQMVSGHQAALARLLDALATPQRAADCFDVLYGRRIRPGEYGLALVEAVAHVNHLARQGLIRGEFRGGSDDDGAIWWKRTD